MNIVATAVEPEFVEFAIKKESGKLIGGALNIELARLQLDNREQRMFDGRVQVILMRSDVTTIIESLELAGLVEKPSGENDYMVMGRSGPLGRNLTRDDAEMLGSVTGCEVYRLI